MSQAIRVLFSVLLFSAVSGLKVGVDENPKDEAVEKFKSHDRDQDLEIETSHELDVMSDELSKVLELETMSELFTLESLTDENFRAIQIVFFVAVLVVIAIIVWMYWSRGFVTIVSILSYVGALSSMSILIRNCYVSNGFKYPQFLTATHFLSTATVGASIMLFRRITQGKEINVPDMMCFLQGLLPVAAAMVLNLGFSNNGLLLTNAHFYEMTGSSTALMTAGLAILLGKGFDMRLMPPLGLITAALFVIAFGEMALVFWGAMACGAAVVMRAIKSTLQHSLMSGSEWKAMDPVEVAVWTSATCFVLMTAWSAATEGVVPYQEIQAWGPLKAVLMTCVGATILNIAALFVLRELGPVAQQIVGQMKGVLAIVGAVAMQGEHVSKQQVVGYGILMAGIYWYNTTDMSIKDEKKNMEESAKGQKV